MPSLIHRPNGLTTHPLKGARGNILLKTTSNEYNTYLALRSDDKAILDTLLYVSSTNTNHFIVANHTLDVIVEKSGYAKKTVLNALTRLETYSLIAKLDLAYEYIVNPLFAIKGSECDVWKFIQTIQYKGNIPKDVTLTCETINLSTNH